jgi:hypothetical protein
MSNYATSLSRAVSYITLAVQVFCLVYIGIAAFNLLANNEKGNPAYGLEEVVGGSVIFVATTLLSWVLKGWLSYFKE